MKKKRVLLWVLLILSVICFVCFTVVEQILVREDQAYQALIRKGWTSSLHEYGYNYRPIEGGSDILVDAQGRIWVLGLRGLHMFDGFKWESRDGGYYDLAVDPGGQVWATVGSALQIYDGKQWKNLEDQDLGAIREIEIEIGRDGRIWIKTDDFTADRLVEIVYQQGDYVVAAEPELTITDGYMGSIAADSEGNLWFWVEKYEDDTSEGLYIFNGESLQSVPDQGMDLRSIDQTRFDQQGNAWVMNTGGAVLKYDGQAWTTVVGDNNAPLSGDLHYADFYVDKKGRLWLWGSESVCCNNDSVYLYYKGAWTIFTQENSGIAEIDSNIFGVVVDDLDRLWVASSDSVNMTSVEEAKPVSEESVTQHRQLLSLMRWVKGANWFIPSLLLILWFAVYLNTWPGVLLALGLGVIGAFGLDVTGYLSYGLPYRLFVYYEDLLNPIVLTIYGGMAGGLIGGQIDKKRDAKGRSNLYLNYILAIIGLIIGLALGNVPWFIVAMAH